MPQTAPPAKPAPDSATARKVPAGTSLTLAAPWMSTNWISRKAIPSTSKSVLELDSCLQRRACVPDPCPGPFFRLQVAGSRLSIVGDKRASKPVEL